MIRKLPLFTRAFVDSWRSTLGWALGLAGAIFIYLPIYPSVGGPEMQQMIDAMPAEMTKALGYEQIATGSGYVQATLFGPAAPLSLPVPPAAAGPMASSRALPSLY
jgi:ABC-2 type transport system permease protein